MANAKISKDNLLERIRQIIDAAIKANKQDLPLGDITYTDITMGFFRSKRLNSNYLKNKDSLVKLNNILEKRLNEALKEKLEKELNKRNIVEKALKGKIKKEKNILRKIDKDNDRLLKIEHVYSFIENFYYNDDPTCSEKEYHNLLSHILSINIDSSNIKESDELNDFPLSISYSIRFRYF